MTPAPIRVVLVDDHALVRTGLTAVLSTAPDIDVVGEAANGQAALDLLITLDTDLVLMDLSMPVLDGVQATRALLERRPDSRVVVLSSFADRSRVQDAIAAGAVGYVLKDSSPEELFAAIRSAAAGHAPIDPRVTGALLPGRDATFDPAAVLSRREREVLLLVMKGLANKQIGRELGITERTVKVHLGNCFRRIGVRDRTSAALWAQQHLTGG